MSQELEAAAAAWALAREGMRATLAWARVVALPGFGSMGTTRGRPPRIPIRAYGSLDALDRGRMASSGSYRNRRAAQVRDAVRAVGRYLAAARAVETFRRRTGFPLSGHAIEGLKLLASWRRRRRRLVGQAAAWRLVAQEVGLTVSQLREFARDTG